MKVKRALPNIAERIKGAEAGTIDAAPAIEVALGWTAIGFANAPMASGSRKEGRTRDLAHRQRARHELQQEPR